MWYRLEGTQGRQLLHGRSLHAEQAAQGGCEHRSHYE